MDCGFLVRKVIDYAGLITNRHVLVIEGQQRPGDCRKLMSGSILALRNWIGSRNGQH